MKRTARIAAAILVVLTAVPLFAAAAAENYEWPKAGFVTGSRVNLRSGPSTSAKAVGRFGHDYETGELVVTAKEETGEPYPWYRVLSHQLGEGWIYGKFLFVEETDNTVRRYVMKIREDFGISPALAVKMYGEPMKREERKVK
ncbi:MAG: SH3 domain-containing protein, partial [Synergistaceae bacterium]|nr:SH3 domain-containing protein [Synergistaceae bacterium]